MTPNRTMPRLDAPVRGGDPGAYVRPLAPTLARAVAETDAAKEHDRLGQRYGAARAKLIALEARHVEAEREDARKERRAAQRGAKQPTPTAPPIAVQIEACRREVATLGALGIESSRDLVAAAVPFLADAAGRAEQERASALREAEDLFRAGLAALDRAAAVNAERGWIATLAENGHVGVWREANRSAVAGSRAARLVTEAIETMGYEAEQEAERVEHRRRELEADAKLPPPPGAWQRPEPPLVTGGETIVFPDEEAEATR
jgi:hypothetical protein